MLFRMHSFWFCAVKLTLPNLMQNLVFCNVFNFGFYFSCSIWRIKRICELLLFPCGLSCLFSFVSFYFLLKIFVLKLSYFQKSHKRWSSPCEPVVFCSSCLCALTRAYHGSTDLTLSSFQMLVLLERSIRQKVDGKKIGKLCDFLSSKYLCFALWLILDFFCYDI